MSDPLSWPTPRVTDVGRQAAQPQSIAPSTSLGSADDVALGAYVEEQLGGEFLVERELGRGGMAVVFLAYKRESNLPVALKVLRRDLANDTESRARFHREARTVATLVDPHIMRLFGVRDLRDGGIALVLELAAQGTAKSLLRERQGPLSAFETRTILRDVVRGLAVAHAQGVVHRDIKADNVFFAADGRALLGDFGIAHGQYDDRLTAKGESLGTPTYMAPEQLDDSPVGPTADVYAFGVLAYELLNGNAPWQGESVWSIVHKQKTAPLPDVDRVLARIGNAHEASVLQRCLEKVAARRPANGAALMRELGWMPATAGAAAESPELLPTLGSQTMKMLREPEALEISPAARDSLQERHVSNVASADRAFRSHARTRPTFIETSRATTALTGWKRWTAIVLGVVFGASATLAFWSARFGQEVSVELTMPLNRNRALTCCFVSLCLIAWISGLKRPIWLIWAIVTCGIAIALLNFDLLSHSASAYLLEWNFVLAALSLPIAFGVWRAVSEEMPEGNDSSRRIRRRRMWAIAATTIAVPTIVFVWVNMRL